MDVHTAFLIPDLPEEEVIYMRVPPDLYSLLRECGVNIKKGQVLRLNKCIYGLKQASKCWNKKLVTILSKLGFKQVPEEPCLFVKLSNKGPIFILIWVDDLLIAGNSTAVDVVVNLLQKMLPMKDLGFPAQFIGVNIEKKKNGLFLHQAPFTERALKMFGMQDCRPSDHPAVAVRLKKDDDSSPLEENVPYRSAVGVLLWLSRNTRPDISFAVMQISRFCDQPTVTHWKAVKMIFRYLKGTIHFGLPICKQRPENFSLKIFSDGDHAGDATRKSTGGYLVQLGDVTIIWRCVLFKSICLSSTESEVVFLSMACQELKWLLHLLNNTLPTKISLPVPVYCDNQGAGAISRNNGVSQRTKHIDVRHLFCRQAVEEGIADIKYLPTTEMPADVFTKPLDRIKFCRLRPLLGIIANYSM